MVAQIHRIARHHSYQSHLSMMSSMDQENMITDRNLVILLGLNADITWAHLLLVSMDLSPLN
jgi:hypothetical protein